MSGHTPLPPTLIELPMLPLRDVVVFPHMVIPLFVGRPKSIKALESAMAAERRIMLVAQKTAAKDEPAIDDMFDVGCVSTILQMLKLPDGTVKVLVEGKARAAVIRFTGREDYYEAETAAIEEDGGEEHEAEALSRAVAEQDGKRVVAFEILRTKGASARLRWDLDGMTVHSITGYESAKFFSRGDVDGGFGCSFCGIPDTGPGFIPFPVETADVLPNHR
eukprot:gene26654-48040_t